MQMTSIEWCDATSNLLKYRDAAGKIVWHCEKYSPGCAHCYAETLAHRYGKGDGFSKANTPKYTPFFDDAEADKIVRATYKKLENKRVFIDDMTDLFGDWVPDHIIDSHMALFAYCRRTTFQILTKRAKRMQRYFAENSWNDVIVRVLQHFDSGPYRESPPRWLNWFQAAFRITERESAIGKEWQGRMPLAWPLPNVWLGVSVEDQQRADERIPHLLNTPAAVRFLSCEPLLGPVNLEAIKQTVAPGFFGDCLNWYHRGKCHKDEGINFPTISWVIVGGESGHSARPMKIQWARSIVGQCKAAGVACFNKQLGSKPVDGSRMSMDHDRLPLKLVSRKGSDMSEWPEDLRVREFPTV